MNESITLADLGWTPMFQQQVTLEEMETLVPARVFEVQRTGLRLRFEGEDGGRELDVPLGGKWFQGSPEDRPTVGDWVLFNPASGAIERLLERKSLLKRMSVNKPGDVQLIAANVDVMFLVSSCNEEFNLARMERYLALALALDAGVQPIVVLTKADLTDDADSYREQAMSLSRELIVEVVNALSAEDLEPLRGWCVETSAPGTLCSERKSPETPTRKSAISPSTPTRPPVTAAAPSSRFCSTPAMASILASSRKGSTTRELTSAASRAARVLSSTSMSRRTSEGIFSRTAQKPSPPSAASGLSVASSRFRYC